MNQNLSRRQFVKKSAAAASTLALANQFVHSAPDNKIKLGLIGCGGRGTGAAAQAMNAGDEIQLVAVCDVDAKTAAAQVELLAKQKPNQVSVSPDKIFSGFEDYKNVIAESDVVILATSPGFRPQHFEEAVRQGKHVFMEKPVASDVVGIKRVLAAGKTATEKNLKVGVGLQRRHQPTYQEFVKRIHDGEIGDVKYLRAFWNGSSRPGRERIDGETELEYQIRNWYYYTWLSGDHIVEQHVHNLDVANWIVGSHPIRAQGMGGREVRNEKINGQIFDHHFVEFEYANGTRMWSQSRQIPECWRSVTEHLTGTLGEANFNVREFSLTGKNSFEKRLRKGENGHQLEHFPLFDAIRNDTPYNEAEHGATATMTAILGRMSNYSGQPVTWEKAMESDQRLVPDDLVDFNSEPPLKPNADGYYPVAVPGVTKPYEIWY
ncbi:Gfo/Idh/MocA family oxidoreductase [Verrucomicrobiales bacterium]|mgnify:CR=1 FL=1|nr:Gfo/Idh/MocA family oxidoreductase [Verrucomicrobiales bacterium]MDC0275989.1 Gfo/Idh/MocA family oxidoreductase [Verrucomicrobiales bacterium]MDC0322091.1 Gfo/Idh/MocA family oxidoreductase [Verrucomicrobiales bacterium]